MKVSSALRTVCERHEQCLPLVATLDKPMFLNPLNAGMPLSRVCYKLSMLVEASAQGRSASLVVTATGYVQLRVAARAVLVALLLVPVLHFAAACREQGRRVAMSGQAY